MKGIARYLLVAAMVLMCFGSCRHGKVIPKKDFAAIYAEMFLADQWLNDNPKAKRAVDTTRFYDVIFEKFGYTFADYDASVNYYLDDPSRYAKILDQTEKILNAKLKELKLTDAEMDRFKRIHTVLTPYRPSRFWPRPKRDSNCFYIPPLDSLELDSLRRDSLRTDSLRLDSLRLDSLRLDSLRRDSIRLDSLEKLKSKPIIKRINAPGRNRVRADFQ